jgi:predicted transcriptional regulator
MVEASVGGCGADEGVSQESPCNLIAQGWRKVGEVVAQTRRWAGDTVWRDGAVADRAKNLLGPLEARVMEVVWAAGRPIAVRDVVERLNEDPAGKLAYTTVMTVMSRLAEKGALIRYREGRGYLYEAAANDAAGIAVQEVLREFRDAAMAQFVDETRADPKLLRRLRRLLADEP